MVLLTIYKEQIKPDWNLLTVTPAPEPLVQKPTFYDNAAS